MASKNHPNNHPQPSEYHEQIESVNDFLLNEVSSYIFLNGVENKEILIDEERVIYSVKKGDYLGKIAKEFNVRVFELKKWNNLDTSHLDVGDKLVIYVKIHDKI